MNLQKNIEWLVIFFVHEIREVLMYSDKLLKTIRESPTDNNDVWVLYEKVVPDLETHKAHFELIVMQLQEDGTGRHLRQVPLEIFEVKKVDRNSWRNVITYLYRELPCKRRILFTWSHGAAFGFNAGDAVVEDLRSDSFCREDEKDRSFFEVENPYHYLTVKEVQEVNGDGHVPFISPESVGPDEYLIVKKKDDYDCKKAEVLWMSDLAEVLATALDGKKIDLLVMMNCYMQLFENGFMLRNVVDVLVGPETKMWAYGYDYAKLLNYLSFQPGLCNRELAEKIIADYVAMHEGLGHVKYLASTAMFANSLQGYQTMATILEEVLQSLLKKWEVSGPLIKDLREKYFYSVSGRRMLFLLEIKLFIDTIFATTALRPESESLHETFSHHVNEAVWGKHIGKDFIKSDRESPKQYGHACSGLFFPMDTALLSLSPFAWCVYISQQRRNEFQEATAWEEFVLRVISLNT